MESHTSDCVDELISTEHLIAFSVVEHFCEACGDLTPHHIDESKKLSTLSSTDTIFVPPISTHECVVCREEEENSLDGFHS